MNTRSLHRALVPLGVLALAASLAGCRDSTDSASGGSGGSGGSSSSAPIKIMQIGTFESSALSLPDAKAGLDAHVKALNAAGGISGHKIEVEFCNDAYDANTGAACARQAVTDGVVAIVGAASAEASSELPILEQAGIPWLGGAGSGGPIEATSKDSYPINGGTQAMEVGMGRLLADKGAKDVAVIIADATAAYAAGDAIKQGAEAGGASTFRVLAPLGAADFSAVASSALAKDPDGVAVASTATDGPRIIQAVRQAGYTGPISTLSNIFKPADQKSLGDNADNVFVTSSLVPVSNTSIPEVKQFLADMAKYYPDAVTDNSSLGTWAAVSLLQGVVEQIGDDAITAKSIVAKLDDLDQPIKLGTVPDYDGVPATPAVKEFPRVPGFDIYVSEAKAGALVQDGDTLDPLAAS